MINKKAQKLKLARTGFIILAGFCAGTAGFAHDLRVLIGLVLLAFLFAGTSYISGNQLEVE